MSSHKKANARTGMYEYLINAFNAQDTIYEWEANDCSSSSRAAFPNYGDYANVPQFAIREVTEMDWDGNETTNTADACYVTSERTDFIVWEKNAFRNCVL